MAEGHFEQEYHSGSVVQPAQPANSECRPSVKECMAHATNKYLVASWQGINLVIKSIEKMSMIGKYADVIT